MKKLLLTIIILLCLFTFLTFNWVKKSRYDYIVYIESISSRTLKSGSGLVFKKNGNDYYILTNYHIVNSSNNIIVYNISGKKTKGILEYYDDYTDVAIIRVKDINLKEIDKYKCNYSNNDNISIIGMSDLKINKKSGTITKDNITIDVPNIYGNSKYNAIMIKANVDYGDSGSIILDKNKNVIGILSVKDKSSNNGYAIPICDALTIANKLENNEIYRPDLRAKIKNSEMEIPGVLIEYISDDSMLNDSKILSGDIITKVNNIKVDNISEFRNELYKYKKNDKIFFEYYRENNFDTTFIVLK